MDASDLELVFGGGFTVFHGSKGTPKTVSVTDI
jgi:hypothetical protein